MYGIAIDMGTSGFRAQLIDLGSSQVLETAMTEKHPLPGGNITDHLDFAITVGESVAHEIIIDTICKLIQSFSIDPAHITKMAVCGNPIQLSFFQNSEIRDLAYAGENMQKRLGIGNIERNARVFPASEIFENRIDMSNCEIIVPPAVRHEIGADALAMMLETDFLEQSTPTIVTDYGTNAEMAIKVGDRIITASAAAGPAIEGQGVSCGMLASPGAISDVNIEGKYWRLTVLDEHMISHPSHLVDPSSGDIVERSTLRPLGITGTGLIACLALAMQTGLIESPPNIKNGRLFLSENIVISENDIKEAGKAIGAIRASQLTLIIEAGIAYEELENMYMTGASGTYVDPRKAMYAGSCPKYSKRIVQFGNTSLALARKILTDSSKLDEVIELSKKIKVDHLMMATSDTFKKFYTCELSYWTEGMDMQSYNRFLKIYKLPALPSPSVFIKPEYEVCLSDDIKDTNPINIRIINDIGVIVEESAINCIMCHQCEKECPEKAIHIVHRDNLIYAEYNAELCLGTSCKRCIGVCPVNAINYRDINTLYERSICPTVQQAASSSVENPSQSTSSD
ncbi:methylamine methyltransferase corrinoid protein reductive activase [Methanolobus halotolerans]|uniref:Methylamine utilization protein n=1 Tax=Methanolobus halotolerans TaxID=2052935 RepID=A0A4E0PXA5_9EURY|nr:methylamine methyltransferase corrinoid protein reductive activase [Methanolobus halotolerans]TGC10671.1 methylamine utilization protein [Methanolobus halotolerans]